jgi:hypothetical protein
MQRRKVLSDDRVASSKPVHDTRFWWFRYFYLSYTMVRPNSESSTVVDSNPRLGCSQEDPSHPSCSLGCEETNCRKAGMSSFFSNRSSESFLTGWPLSDTSTESFLNGLPGGKGKGQPATRSIGEDGHPIASAVKTVDWNLVARPPTPEPLTTLSQATSGSLRMVRLSLVSPPCSKTRCSRKVSL